MSASINQRKIEHIDLVAEHGDMDRRKFYFDPIRLRHRALPELNFDEVDTTVEFMGRTLSFPLLISSMTGGDHAQVERINRNLARAAEQTGIAMGVGSQRVLFTHADAARSFQLRDTAPTALLFANLGAVQLNDGFGLDACRRAVNILEADGLYFHLNALQEIVQPAGDTNFRGLAQRIGEVAARLDVPVLVKEVGAGLGRPDAELLANEGIRYIDVAGAGGTSWSRIEHYRNKESADDELGMLFQDWGIPTPLALRELAPLRERITLIASGGVRSGVDMVKALALGASLCGMARPFLQPAMESADAVIRMINRLQHEFRVALFLVGIPSARELIANESVILNEDY